MRRALILLAALLTLSVFASPSRAQFIECDVDYVDSFRLPAEASDPGWSPGQVHCHEFFRFSFSTPAGTRWIRLIGDENAARTVPPGTIDQIEDAARRSARMMSRLGPYLVDDITMLLGQPRPSSGLAQPEFGYDDAWTVSGEGAEFRECKVTLFITFNHEPVDTQQTVGHELFHCVQKATLPEAITDTQTFDGMWWGEGSAEVFGIYVANSAGGRYNRAAVFEQAVAARSPLYSMSYEAVVFFLHLVHEDGMDAILPFLRGMASSNGADAQMAAMRAVRPAEYWAGFAQAYDDRTIRGPTGLPLSFGQRVEGTNWRIDASDVRHERELQPFVIELGWNAYECGVWENTLSRRSIEVRREDAREWTPWPENVDTEERGDVRYRLATMTTEESPVTFSLIPEKRESCTTCQVSRVIDACMVGVWEQTGGGPMDFIRRVGIPQVVRDQIGKLVIVMEDDGTMATRTVPVDYEIMIPDPDGPRMSEGFGAISPSTGRWSAADGQVQACFDSGGEFSGVMTMEVQGHTVVIPHSTGGVAGISGSSNYACSDTTLTTSSPMPSGGTMTYTFRRLTPPPRR